DIQAKGQCDVGTDLKTARVRLQIVAVIHGWRLMQLDQDLRAGHGQAFARPDVEGHTAPAPRIDLQLERSKRLHLRGWGDTAFAAIAVELPAHQVLLFQWGDSPQHLDLFIPDGFTVGAYRRLHRQVGQDLEQMILDDVADRTRLIIKRAPSL